MTEDKQKSPHLDYNCKIRYNFFLNIMYQYSKIMSRLTHIYYVSLLGGAAGCSRYRAQVKMFCHFDSLSLIYYGDKALNSYIDSVMICLMSYG